MRVTLISPYSFAVPGGVQGQVIGIAAALARLGACVEVLAPGTPGSAAPGLSYRLERVGRTVALPANGSRAPVTLSPLALARTAAALGRFRPDVVHLHEPFVPGPTLAALVAKRAPLLGTFHRADASASYRALRPLLRALLARLDDCVAVSDAARETLLAVAGRSAQRCAVVANGVDVTRFASARAARPTGAPGPPVVVFLGRHEGRKGLATLLDAIDRLTLPIRLEVIGAGPETARLRAAHPDSARVRWLGRLADDEVAARLAAADLFVAPSLSGESFGVVLLEAMAAGTAVVASDLPGYRLAARDAAHFVPPGDPGALGAAIEALVAAPERRDELVATGDTRIAESSFEVLARTYLERYRVLAPHAAPAPGAPGPTS